MTRASGPLPGVRTGCRDALCAPCCLLQVAATPGAHRTASTSKCCPHSDWLEFPDLMREGDTKQLVFHLDSVLTFCSAASFRVSCPKPNLQTKVPCQGDGALLLQLGKMMLLVSRSGDFTLHHALPPAVWFRKALMSLICVHGLAFHFQRQSL